MRDILAKLPTKEKYALIRQYYYQNNKDTTATSKFLGIYYNTVSRAISNPNPQRRIYETKIKKEHIIYIYSQTILNPRITGEELSHNIKEFFGDTITPQYINKLRRKQMEFIPPLRSVFVSDDAKAKRFEWTNFHIQNHVQFI